MMTIFLPRVTSLTSVYGLLRQFNFDEESNLPTYFSSISLFIAAILLFSIYNTKNIIIVGITVFIIFSLITIKDK